MAVLIDDVSSKAGWTLDGGRTYEVVVQVESDDPIGGKAAIDACNLFEGLAYRFPMAAETPTEADDSSYLQGVSADPKDDDGRVWTVTLQFGRRNPENDQKGPVDPETGARDPFAAPPQLRSRGDEEQLFLEYDQAGTPILNSLGRPFADAPSIPIPVVVFEVSRLERTFDPSIIDAVQGRLNSAEWLGWPAKSMLALPITASRSWNDDVGGWAWEVTYAFAFKKPVIVSSKKVRPGWVYRALDCDTLDADGNEFLDDKGVAPSQPTLLDGSGGKLDPSTTPPVYREFEIYPTADFSVLGFPADLFTAGTPEA